MSPSPRACSHPVVFAGLTTVRETLTLSLGEGRPRTSLREHAAPALTPAWRCIVSLARTKAQWQKNERCYGLVSSVQKATEQRRRHP